VRAAQPPCAALRSPTGSIIAACTLAISQSKQEGIISGKGEGAVALAFMLPAVGIICSIVGYFAVNTSQQGQGWNVQLGALMWALEKGMYLAGGLFVIGSYFATDFLGLPLAVWGCVCIGAL
jgi:Na+/H+-translocating membrane pyrophosphatase